jgi:hypothetical protein
MGTEFPRRIVSEVRLDIFPVMKIQVADFCVVTLCSDAIGYQCFRGPCCLLHQGELKMEAAWSSETLISYHIIT